MGSAPVGRGSRVASTSQTQLLAVIIGTAAVVGLFLSLETLISGPSNSEGSQERISAIAGAALGGVGLVLAGYLSWQSERQRLSIVDAVLDAGRLRHELEITLGSHAAPEAGAHPSSTTELADLLDEGRGVHQRLVDVGADEEAESLLTLLVRAQDALLEEALPDRRP